MPEIRISNPSDISHNISYAYFAWCEFLSVSPVAATPARLAVSPGKSAAFSPFSFPIAKSASQPTRRNQGFDTMLLGYARVSTDEQNLELQTDALERAGCEERDLTRERTMAGLAAARARGRRGGRPPALSPRQVTQARHLMQHPDQTMAEIAATLGVSRSTLYRSLRTETS